MGKSNPPQSPDTPRSTTKSKSKLKHGSRHPGPGYNFPTSSSSQPQSSSQQVPQFRGNTPGVDKQTAQTSKHHQTAAAQDLDPELEEAYRQAKRREADDRRREEEAAEGEYVDIDPEDAGPGYDQTAYGAYQSYGASTAYYGGYSTSQQQQQGYNHHHQSTCSSKRKGK